MANVKISALPAITPPLVGADTIPVVQSGVTSKATMSNVLSYVDGNSVRQVRSALSISSGVVNIDCSLGDYFTLALTANVTSITFSNLPASGLAASIIIQITQDTTPRTVAWPSSFKWAGGVAGSVSTGSGAKDVLAITTFDNGTAWMTTMSKVFS